MAVVASAAGGGAAWELPSSRARPAPALGLISESDPELDFARAFFAIP